MQPQLPGDPQLLRELILRVRPWLPELGKALTRSYSQREGHYGGLMAPRIETENFDERGIELAQRHTQTNDPQSTRIDLAGSGLVLLTDGRLAEIRRTGHTYSNVEDVDWTAILVMISIEDAAARYGFVPCQELQRILARHEGSAR